ncbi:NAD(P)/FAD-dependent oxidoreductase [Candidatus Poriferisocius sp.]|uniref:NAD(P)/FAD-dependent oxidoreductase n=1 Tax=Candidatus Poriferisocius sp. TaxID=3101276 RepID=UPI003B01D053
MRSQRQDRTVDVAVIGGGIAGASCAYHLAREGLGTVLVERETELGTHSTSRSAATLLPGYGGQENDELTEAGRPFFASSAEGMAEHPLLAPRELLWIYPREPEGANHDLPGTVPIDYEAALAMCPVLRPEAIDAVAWQAGVYDIDVDGLLRALVRGATHHGAEVLLASEAASLRRQRGYWLMEGGAEIRARVVVNAAGAWADELAERSGLAPVGFRALKRTAFVSPVSTGQQDMAMVVSADNSFYFKPDVGGLMLCSPADETPVAPGDPRPEEIDVAYTIDRINVHTTLQIRSVRRAWAGLRVFAADRRPVIRPHQDDATFIWCAGLGGTGVQTAPGAGQRVAEIVQGLFSSDW